MGGEPDLFLNQHLNGGSSLLPDRDLQLLLVCRRKGELGRDFGIFYSPIDRLAGAKLVLR